GLQPSLEGRRLPGLRTDDVDDGRKGRVVGGNREERDLEPLPPSLGKLDGERKALDGLFRPFARLVGDGTIAETVDVSGGVAAADRVVAALAQDGPRGAAEQLLALLVPENDLVGRIDCEDSFAAPSDAVEGFGSCRHEFRR